MPKLPDPSDEQTSLSSGDGASLPVKRRAWGRYVMYMLAALGLLLIALVLFIIVREKTGPKRATIDESEVIDTVMTRTYGKYSDEKKGWLFVGQDNRTYLVHVIQQAKPQDGPKGDELYFVASGAPLDGEAGGVYGVFQVRAGTSKEDKGSLVEVSSPYEYDGSVAVAPEAVRFEALSDNLWGWVIKVQHNTDPKLGTVDVKNVVLAPHGDAIVTLAAFKASRETDPGMSCAEANQKYQEFMQASADAESLTSTPEGETAAAAETAEPEELPDPEEAIPPTRCDKASWSYSTAAAMGHTPGPLAITVKGMLDGAQQPSKTWKVVFDTKGFLYNVPAELKPDSVDSP
jgi:hypothetical protein